MVRICGSTSEKVGDMIRRLEDLKRDYPNDAAIIFMPHTGGDPDSVDWSQFQAIWEEKVLASRSLHPTLRGL